MDVKNRVLYKAAAYVRLSKEDIERSRGEKDESNSIKNQKQLILDFVQGKDDIEIVSIPEDDGYTGTDYDRPAFQRMLEDIRAGSVNCVIVKDLSRFGREYINAGKYIDRLFPCYGVRLIAINDNIDTITGTGSADFNIMLKNLMNDNYCRDISIKIRSQLQVKRKNGEFIGAFAPYGYTKSEEDKNQLVIDPYAAEVVKDIFHWKLEGLNNDAICKRLIEQGILSPMEYKRSKGLSFNTTFKTNEQAQWTPVAVRRILTNPVYTGTLVQGVRTRPNYKIKTVIVNEQDKWAVVENAHEPIIDSETFSVVQRLLELDTRTSQKSDRVLPLAGLVICGDCHGNMVRKTTSSGGKKFAYYICGNHKKTGACSSHQISEKVLEQDVLRIMQEHIRMITEMLDCMKAIKDRPTMTYSGEKIKNRLVAVDEELERYRRLKVSAYEDMKDGVLSKDDYFDISGRFDSKIRQAITAQGQLQRELSMFLREGKEEQGWIRAYTQYQNLQSLERVAAVRLIDKVSVYEGKRISVDFSHEQDYGKLLDMVKEYYTNNEEVSLWPARVERMAQ